ncbi:MAG: hypothetical protein HDS38_07450 [Bacteroides sp.]|nr:hypothetical protein [Bacteroides sp.]
MTQTADIQPSYLTEILEKLRHQAQSLPPSPTASRYLRALASLEASVGTYGSCVCESSGNGEADLSQEKQNSSFIIDDLSLILTDWLINQWLLGLPFSSATLYLDIISALYGSAVKAGLLPPTETFTLLRAELKALGPEGWKSGINGEIFSRALRLTKNAHRLLLDDSIAADLILLSLTNSLQPIEQLALLKRDDISALSKTTDSNKESLASPPPLRPLRDTHELHKIASRHLNGNARRKYIFPLNQSERTPAQLKKHIFKITNALFRRTRLPQATDPNRTVEALWAYAALRAGVPASTIVAHLGHAPLGLPVLKLCNISTLREAPILRSRYCEADTAKPTLRSRYCEADTFRAIGSVFLDNPPAWYAMSLRPGVRFTQVCRRIQLLSKPNTAQRAHTEPSAPILRASLTDTPFSSLQLFYPCEEIARAIGKKIVIKQRPFIHSVVFFKAKLTDIGPLFACIGDLAWCYKETARPGAPYAHISQQQFELFQRTIARFTPDYEVAPTGELQLKKNDRVEIVGGLFAGHEATFEGLEAPRPPEGGRGASTVYRLNIIGDNGIEWRVSLDSRIVKSGL